MGNKKKQGQGSQTRRKEEGFSVLLQDCLSLSKGGAARQFNYWHIDLNAGCGFNHEVGIPGSPVVFLDAVERQKRHGIAAVFCDEKQDRIAELRGAVAGHPARRFCGDSGFVESVCTDNARALEIFGNKIEAAERRSFNAVGSCVVDPNGPKEIPYEALRRFTAKFPRIDLILNLPAFFYRLARKAPGDFSKYPEPLALTAQFPRQNWLVRNISFGTGWPWIILLGRQKDLDERRRKKFADFFPLESPQGRQVITEFRRADPPGQGSLFPGWGED